MAMLSDRNAWYCPAVQALRVCLVLGVSTAYPERLPIRAYTTADGLANNRVIRIVRDPRGFLWFCTADGLSRFDGYVFSTYRDPEGLSHTSVTDLTVDGADRYWVATSGGGICRFYPRGITGGPTGRADATRPLIRFSNHRVGDDTWTNTVNVLARGSDGTLWAGTDDGLFRLVDRRQGNFEKWPIASDAQLVILSMQQDAQGTLWLGTPQGLLRRHPDGRIETHPAQWPRARVRALLTDRHGRLWIGMDSGLLVVPRETAVAGQTMPRNPAAPLHPIQLPKEKGEPVWFTIKTGLPDNMVLALHEGSDGTLWIGTDRGLASFDSGGLKTYAAANGLIDTRVLTIAEDESANLWIGTETAGALRIARSGFTVFDEADGLVDSRITAIFEDRRGELCVVSDRWTLHRFDGIRFHPVRPRLPARLQRARRGNQDVLLQDQKGNWWLSSTDGLWRYDALSSIVGLEQTVPIMVYPRQHDPPYSNVYRLFGDSRGNLWISMVRPSGLVRWDHASRLFRAFEGNGSLPRLSYPSAFCEDRGGDIWIGLRAGGLVRYRSGRLEAFSMTDGIPRGMIRGLYQDRAGRLWIASVQGGVARSDDPSKDRPSFAPFTTAQGLSSNNVGFIVEDFWGRLYFATGRGIDRLDPATGQLRHFDVADGVPTAELRVGFRDRSGALWFGTYRGLVRLQPQLEPDRTPPAVLISRVLAAGVPHPVSDLGDLEVTGVSFGPGDDAIEIEFFGLDFEQEFRYQYRLEGPGRQWSPPTTERRVHYAGMAPGRYRFMVRAVSAVGSASDSTASVTFQVVPPIWRSWWFLSAVAAAVAVTIYLLHRYRLQRLLELERVRTRIATDLHDDIGSSLSQIAILSEVAKRQPTAPTAGGTDPLTVIANTSRELVASMSDIVWAINPRHDSLQHLTRRMRRFASDILSAAGIEVEFHTTEGEQRLGSEYRRQVFLIFKESIHNIERHSEARAVWIDFTIDQGRLLLEMRDNGRGFDLSRSEAGHGLENMRNRAEDLGGRLTVTSAHGCGTKVCLLLPLNFRRRRPGTYLYR
jgi:ligand-binding sensor domain-containing protein